MAQLIGCSRETVSRTLSEFKRQRLVEVNGATLVVRDLSAGRSRGQLASIAGSLAASAKNSAILPPPAVRSALFQFSHRLFSLKNVFRQIFSKLPGRGGSRHK